MLASVQHETVVVAERLEAEICELAGHLAAATCRYLLLLAEFDRREGWGGWGIRSCAQWLSWKCGISPATAREQLRVARALEELPVITRAFSAGRLSYSKVRALTRVATAGSEAELVETALVTTAAQLERLVAGLRKATRDDVVERHARRKVGWYHDHDGSFVMTIRLDPEEGAVAVAALRAAQGPGPGNGHGPGNGRGAGEACGQGEVPASGDDPAEALDGHGVSAEAPSAGKAEPLALPDALTAVFSAYLAEQARDTSDPEIYQVVIHTDTDGMTTDRPTRPEDAPDRDRTPDDASRETPDQTPNAAPEAAPGGATPRPPRRARRRARGAASNERPDERPGEGPGEAPGGTPLEDAGLPGGHLDDGPALHPDTVRRLACDATTVTLIHRGDGTVLDVGRRTRRIGVRLRRALRLRDRGRCRFPGCERRLHLHAHHIVHWSHGGPTDLNNLASLCTAHHWLVHDGGYRMWLTPDGELRFATPTGTPIPTAPASTPLTGDIQDQHDAAITPDTIASGWDGAPLDLDHAVLALLQPTGT